MYRPDKTGAHALLASALGLALLPLAAQAADETPKAEAKSERKISIKVNGKEQEDVQGAVDAAISKLQSALASKDAALARANVNVNIDVNEIRETIRKSIEDANQYGTMISRRSSDDVVKGNPYSAREVREFKQTLGDGTVISRQSTRLLARDGEGRLRQELRQPDGTARVYINDPVAKEVIILDPQKRLACRADFDKRAINDCFNQTKGDWKPLGFAFNIGKNGVGMMSANDDLVVEVSPHAQIIDLTRNLTKRDGSPVEPPVPPVPPLPPTASLSTLKGLPGSEHAQKTRERKTKQPYEGLLVDTDRSVETIPAGTIGNNKAIESVYERYYSPELKMNVYVRRTDPRNGESVYRMIDVKRSEPDASVFRAPSGYTMVEGKK